MNASTAIRTLLGSVLLGIAIVSVALASAPRTAHACSGPVVSPADTSFRYVVGGWVRAISYEEQHPVYPDEPLEVTYTFQVDRAWRGDPPSSFTFVDTNSATGDTDEITWYGLCGAMSRDPTDRYFLLSIPEEEGSFSTFNLYGVGSGPNDPSLEDGLARLAEAFGLEPGSTGNAGTTGSDGGGGTTRAALAALAVLLVTASRWSVGRTRRAAVCEQRRR